MKKKSASKEPVESAPEPENETAVDPGTEVAPTDDDIQKQLEKMTARNDRIVKANKRLHTFQNKVMQSTQAHRAATAKLKADIGDRDKAALELQRIIDDVKHGQSPLPGMEDVDDEPVIPAAAGTSENWPISELGVKQIKAIAGAEAFDAAKEAGDPIGMSDKQLEKLESADLTTIAALEEKMMADSWWWKNCKIANDGHSSIVQRIISTLLAFRKVHPKPELTPTVLDKLAEQNGTVKADELVAGASA